jgi:hypothetical protein
LVDIVSQQYEILVHKLQLLFSVAHLSARSPTHSKYPLSWSSLGGGDYTTQKWVRNTLRNKSSTLYSANEMMQHALKWPDIFFFGEVGKVWILGFCCSNHMDFFYFLLKS